MIETRTFILAGNATFTIKSKQTGTRFTYRVSKPRGGHAMGNVYFVGVLTGVDNQSNYSYIGMIDAETDTPIFRLTKKSKLSNDAQSVVAFRWFFAHAMTGELPETCEFYHAGKCCRCGRKLTVPESITDGVGPECKGKICKY